MKKILLISFFISALQLFASDQASVNMALRRKLNQGYDGNSKMFVLVKGDIDQIKKFVAENNGTFINSARDIASIKLSMGAIAQLITLPFVKRIGSDVHSYRTMNDTMRMLARVNEVQQGELPLTSSYKGRGVLMGIIDSGIDLHHPDFQDSTGHTRIKYLWDMTLPYSGLYTPALYGYGQEFNKAQIDNGDASAHTGEQEYGHGTYVTGIAAGNGRAVGNYQGVATESDLIIVGYDFNAFDTVPRIAHAVEYIFNIAHSLGMPVVINASLGDYYGSHDGMDLESEYVSYMIDDESPRVLVAAAGNIGANYPFHVGRNSAAGDTVFTWFKYNAGYPGAYIQVFADTADFRNVKFSIGADKITPDYSFRGQTNFTSVFSSLNHVVYTNLFNGGNRLGRIETYTSEVNGVYMIEIFINVDSTAYNWRLTTTGNGKYDSWSLDYAWQSLPDSIAYSEMANYWMPDTTQSMVSGIACLNNVITVGNYNNTDRHVDVDSVLQITATDYPRQLGPNSGRGPTRDGRIKPDITAPGNHIISCGVASLIPGLTHNKIAPGGYHITGGGTSASSPVVAGIVAMYLEQNPTCTWVDVKNAIMNCSYTDSLTWGPYPNNAWGMGKVNAFEALTTCSLIIGVNEINANEFILYPNPASSELNVEMISGIKATAKVSDIQGRILFSDEFENMITIPLTMLQDGVYFIHLENEDSRSIVKKFVVSR